MSDVTRIIESIEAGDARAAKDLLLRVYDELRRLAAMKLTDQPVGQTLQATALVHEAYLRLIGCESKQWSGRKHFFNAAAEAMRHILVENARRKARPKHGGDQQRLDIAAVEISLDSRPDRIQQVDEALDHLETEDPLRAEVVKLRAFAGLTIRQVADLTGLSERTVERHWSYAKAWLFRWIQNEENP